MHDDLGMSEATQMCFTIGRHPSPSVWLFTVSALFTEGLLTSCATGTRSSSDGPRAPCRANYSTCSWHSREMNLRQDRRQISLDRYGCLAMYEEISLSMMIRREGMAVGRHTSSLPEARGSSLRMLRDIMRHSEMLTELLLMSGSPSPFKHIEFAQCSSPLFHSFSCCRCYNATHLEITQTPQHH